LDSPILDDVFQEPWSLNDLFGLNELRFRHFSPATSLFSLTQQISRFHPLKIQFHPLLLAFSKLFATYFIGSI